MHSLNASGGSVVNRAGDLGTCFIASMGQGGKAKVTCIAVTGPRVQAQHAQTCFLQAAAHYFGRGVIGKVTFNRVKPVSMGSADRFG